MKDLWAKPEPVESDLQSEIIKFAHRRRWFCEKIESRSGRGMQDLLCIRSGVHIFMEVKKTGEDARRQQELRAQEMRDHGATVYTVDTFEQAREILR